MTGVVGAAVGAPDDRTGVLEDGTAVARRRAGFFLPACFFLCTGLFVVVRCVFAWEAPRCATRRW